MCCRHQLPPDLQKSFDSKQQTLRAVTIKQLSEASNNRVDDSLVIDGKDITNVGLVLHTVGGWVSAASGSPLAA